MTATGENTVFSFLGYRLDPGRRQLTDPDGAPVTLRAKVYDTLLELVTNAGQPMGKAELMQAVWPDAVVEENNLNQAISALRQALGDDRNDPRFIATITGRGYQFVAPVERIAPDAAAPASEPAITPATVEPGRGNARLIIGAAVVAAIAVVVALWPEPVSEPPSRVLDSAVLVTTTPGNYESPTLSPDGTFMAFVSQQTGTAQIWVMGLPDGQPRQLTFGDDPATSPSWSPVDDVILFERAAQDGVRAAWRVDALGGEQARVVMPDARSPQFAADGRRFVFIRGPRGIHVGELDSGNAYPIEGIPETAGFAPPMPAMNARGDIAFVLADEGPAGNLWLYEAETGEFRQLTEPSGEFAGDWVRAPSWLPDGERIVYSAAPADPANPHLWQIDIRTGEITQLSSGTGGYDSPVVSRDGTRLVYSHARAVFALVSTDPVTGEHTTLYESRASMALPSVAPDGERLVYFGDHVFTFRIGDSAPRALTSAPIGAATLPAWSRTGDAIYYYLGRTLHRLDPETGQSTLLLDDFHWSKQNWLAAHGNRLAYNVRNIIPALRRTVVHDLDTGEKTRVETGVWPTDFSRDGTTLLARRKGFEIVTCEAPDFACTPVIDGDGIAEGAIPRWSHDEQRIFFRRARQDRRGYAGIWVVDREGGPSREVAEIGPYDPLTIFFAIAADDQIVWNRFDRAGNTELWMVSLAPDTP